MGFQPIRVGPAWGRVLEPRTRKRSCKHSDIIKAKSAGTWVCKPHTPVANTLIRLKVHALTRVLATGVCSDGWCGVKGHALTRVLSTGVCSALKLGASARQVAVIFAWNMSPSTLMRRLSRVWTRKSLKMVLFTRDTYTKKDVYTCRNILTARGICHVQHKR